MKKNNVKTSNYREFNTLYKGLNPAHKAILNRVFSRKAKENASVELYETNAKKDKYVVDAEYDVLIEHISNSGISKAALVREYLKKNGQNQYDQKALKCGQGMMRNALRRKSRNSAIYHFLCWRFKEVLKRRRREIYIMACKKRGNDYSRSFDSLSEKEQQELIALAQDLTRLEVWPESLT